MWLRRTTLAAVALSIMLAGAGTVRASVVDFDDVTPVTYYFPGQGIITGGMTLPVSNYVYANGATWPASLAAIVNGDPYGLSGSALALTSTQVSVPVATPSPAHTSFEYAAIDGTEGALLVNGQVFRYQSDPLELNGLSLGGVTLSVSGAASAGGFDTGTLSIAGPISSFQVGGANLMVDTITFTPEPATLCLLALGGLTVALARKSKRS